MAEAEIKIVCRNKRAGFLYHIEGRKEAGIALRGSEVKSLRDGQADLSDAYAEFVGHELWLVKAHIAEYVNAGYMTHVPKRSRKLLMHREELHRLEVKLAERGYTIVPLAIYFKKGKAKVELGLARGKKKTDRRESIRQRDEERSRRRGDR